MTIFREPLANYKGEVMLSLQATGVIPAQATQFRGLWVTMNGLICATNDTGQVRKYVGGFALEDPSGLLLVTETAPASVPMDGINANAAGAVVKKTGAGSLVHQGIGMTVSAPGGPLVVNQDEPVLTLHIPFEYGVNSGNIVSTQLRAGPALYRDQDGRVKIAPVDQLRNEFQGGQPLGLLMENAVTNKCDNYNANPDAALTNLTKSGDVAAVLSRVLDIEELNEAGLLTICTSGYVFKLDNSAGSAVAHVDCNATTGSTGPHCSSAYWRGSGTATIGLVSGAPTAVSLPEHYERFVDVARTALASDQWRLTASAGAVVYFILNQLEGAWVESSPVIVEGMSGSRAVDKLSIPYTDPYSRNVINNGEGMAAVLWKPSYSDANVPTGSTRTTDIVRLKFNAGNSFFYFQKNSGSGDNFFINRDTSNYSSIQIPGGLVANRLYLVALRWSGAVKQIGFKSQGTWTWDTEGTYSGAFSISDNFIRVASVEGVNYAYPTHIKDLYFWSEDKGTSWLESFFSEIAN